MRLNRKLSLILRSAVAGIACLSMAGTAFGGTLYRWTTDEGTYAYTDDKKRIPARYRAQAKKAPLRRLKDYDRYTPVAKTTEGSYGERMLARLEGLREANRPQALAGPAAGAAESYISVGGGRYGGQTRLAVPTGAVGMGPDADEPLVVETFRVRKSDGYQSTRTVQVVKRGDQVLSIIKNQRNDGPLTPRYRESDFE
ncbi:MAG: hypothetical protein JRG96_09555 [Deltaproteobacteria bacterium]|nr:hypothetical protein [Deltaproteobacteria bacterium]